MFRESSEFSDKQLTNEQKYKIIKEEMKKQENHLFVKSTEM